MPTWNPVRAMRSVSYRLAAILEHQQSLLTASDETKLRLDGLGGATSALAAQVDALRGELQELREKTAAASALADAASAREMTVLRAIYDDEPGNRRRLWRMREGPDYERPFTVAEPLVSVFITTYENADALASRSIPSVLGQTHSNLELWVVGDAASAEVEEAARSFDDPRVRFVNLTTRGDYPDDRDDRWLVAGTAPANEGLRLAQGDWIAPHCDDDAFTPNHIEVLLAEARRQRLELVYGTMRRHAPDGDVKFHGSFPPVGWNFGVQMGLFHRGLRCFHYELIEWVFGDPGDWGWARRLLRAGVRMGMIDEVVVDYWPSKIWPRSE